MNWLIFLKIVYGNAKFCIQSNSARDMENLDSYRFTNLLFQIYPLLTGMQRNRLTKTHFRQPREQAIFTLGIKYMPSLYAVKNRTEIFNEFYLDFIYFSIATKTYLIEILAVLISLNKKLNRWK